MKALFAVLGLMLVSSTVLAGSDNVDCTNKSKTISFSVGSGSNTIQIKYIVEKTHRPGVYEVPVRLMPKYDGTDNSPQTLTVIPVGHAKMTAKREERQKIYHDDGTFKCYGREFWNNDYVQTMVIIGKDAERVTMWDVQGEKKVKGMDSETGYITDVFYCNAHGASTAGGCFPD